MKTNTYSTVLILLLKIVNWLKVFLVCEFTIMTKMNKQGTHASGPDAPEKRRLVSCLGFQTRDH